ncbi:MAG: DUF4276 family protein [Chloroflexi bacterium]|nr:DUF4276 family protein [Chloroflexota bacterium]
MSLGVMVVGQSERDSIPIILRKLGRSEKIHMRLVPQGEMLDTENISKYIVALLAQDGKTSRILLFLDAESLDPRLLQRQCLQKENELSKIGIRVPVNYIVVDHSLEGWLACDHLAVQSVIGRGAQIKYTGNPEDHPKPAQLLRRWFRAYHKEFSKTTHDPLIAKLVDPAIIAGKSPTFAYLVNILT